MNWTISKKVIAVFAAVIAILLMIGGSTFTSTSQFLVHSEERQFCSVIRLQVEHLFSSIKDAETGQRGFLITGAESYLDPYHNGKKLTYELMEDLKRRCAGDEDRLRRIESLEPVIQDKFGEMEKTIATRREEGFDAAAKIVGTDKGKDAMNQIRRIVDQIRDSETERTEVVMGKMKDDADTLFKIIGFGTTLALIAVFATGILLARNISRPLAEMTAAAERIASGELGGAFGASSRSDEVGVLGNAFSRMNRVLSEMAAVARRIAAGDLSAEVKAQSERDELGTAFVAMQRNLRDVMRETLDAVNVLSSAAAEINASVSQVAAGAAQTAAAITETTATVEEVKKTAELNSDKVRQVSESAQRSAQTSDLGRQSVEGTTAGMNRIRQQMDAIGASMIRLSEQTLAIGEIIATVNDLAEQSNILAVNASIEAAKAGEQGKGFAVVAQEVRSLAEQSKQATTQVRTMLNEIQKATSGAMLATEQGSKAVNAGLEQSEQAGQSIAALSEGMMRSAQAALQIAASSQQQAVGMDQVTIAIRNIQHATLQNAGIVKQVEESACMLHELGLKLKLLVERYKT